MASPSSSGPSTAASTPSITVTPDESAEPRPLDLELPEALVERVRSLTFDLPAEESKVRASVRPTPERSRTSDAALTADSKANSPAVATADEQVTPKALPLPQDLKRPEVKRTGSSFLTGLGRNLSSSNLLGRNKNGQSNAKKTPDQSGTATPRTPEVRDLFYGTMIPDLAAVNRALDSLRDTKMPANDPYVSNLTHLAAELEKHRSDCKKILTQAMKQRDNGNAEICRALCLSIVQSKASEIDTKVYAYNILSTQASPGQSLTYLQEAWNLVKEVEHVRPDAKKLLGVIAVLKEGAVAKEGSKKMFKANGERDYDFEAFGLPDLERSATAPKKASEGAMAAGMTPRQLLKVPKAELPKEVDGVMTPRTEKIFRWAAGK